MTVDEDTHGVIVKGRIAGCPIAAEWWVRLVPMFGSEQSSVIWDAKVGGDGRFQFRSPQSGVRHILLVLKDRMLVASRAVDLTQGQLHDLGTIDVSSGCEE